MEVQSTAGGTEIDDWVSIGAEFSGEPSFPEGGSQEEFISEHYWGYATQRDGGTLEYQVEHPQWQVWTASKTSLDGDVIGFFGPEFASALASQPSSAFVADGSQIAVRKGIRIDERMAV